MGFLQGLGRMIKGEPVYQAGDSPSGVPPVPAPSGKKSLPLVSVQRVEHNDTGNGTELYWTLKNESEQQVMLDKIMLFGHTDDQQEYLQPGETHELLVYRGDKLQNDSYTKAEIWYKNDDGDYFSSKHLIEYRADMDGTYEVYRVKFLAPVNDV